MPRFMRRLIWRYLPTLFERLPIRLLIRIGVARVEPVDDPFPGDLLNNE